MAPQSCDVYPTSFPPLSVPSQSRHHGGSLVRGSIHTKSSQNFPRITVRKGRHLFWVKSWSQLSQQRAFPLEQDSEWFIRSARHMLCYVQSTSVTSLSYLPFPVMPPGYTHNRWRKVYFQDCFANLYYLVSICHKWVILHLSMPS